MNAMLEDAFNKLLDALDAAAPNKVLLAVDLRRALEVFHLDGSISRTVCRKPFTLIGFAW
jgi:hypothetical protein